MTSTLVSWLDNRYVIFLGWALGLALWQTTAIGVLLAGWMVWRPATTSDRRYRVGMIGLLAAVLLALSTPVQLSILQSLPTKTQAASAITSGHSEVGPPAITDAASSAGPVGSTERVSSIIATDRIASVAALLWVFGVVLLAGRILGGLWLAHSIANRASSVLNPAIVAAASRLEADLKFARPTRMLESADVEAPVVLGWRSPTLILPHDATERLSADMIAALLAHEFAHIRRRDYAANILQSVVEILLFFSPLVIWISRRIREAREFCCDDAAVDRCGDRKNYVEALTSLASLGAVNSTRAALSSVGPRLITRIRRLLQGEAMPRFQRARLISLAVLFLGLVAVGIQLSAASAGRAPRLSADSGSPLRLMQDKIPYGFAHEQTGSGVDLHQLDSTIDEPARMAAIKNVSNQPIVGLRFIAAVERWTTLSRMPARVFVSPVVSVTIPPGQTVEVAPNVLTAAQVQAVAAESPGATLQLFFGLQSVRFANGYEWSISPNVSAVVGSDAANIPRPVYSRALIERDAGKSPVSYGACRDEQNRVTSHGGRVPILNEPGHAMVCDNGRWIDAASQR
jgi:beta-lactamase regulating signal transducer with metallopeptidase domain